MTYVVHIWEHHPSPQTWAEADALQARLDCQPAPPNPKFAALAAGLVQAFPHRRDGQTRSPWIEGAPDGRVDHASWALGVDTDLMDRVLPVLVNQALALGLTVYDGQTGEVFLPGNWCLTPEGRTPVNWPEPAVEPVAAAGLDAGRSYLEGRVRALVLPHFAPSGFQLCWRTGLQTHDALAMVRDTALGQQRIEMTPQSWSEQHWDLWMSCEIEPRLPPDLAKWCEPQHTIPLARTQWPELAAFRRRDEQKPYEPSFRCMGPHALDQFLGLYTQWAVRELLPLLDGCVDLAGYLRLDGREASPEVFLQAAVAGLALAHCAGDPALAERAQRYGQQRVPNPRPDLFHRRLGGLAGFAQYFGMQAQALR